MGLKLRPEKRFSLDEVTNSNLKYNVVKQIYAGLRIREVSKNKPSLGLMKLHSIKWIVDFS